MQHNEIKIFEQVDAAAPDRIFSYTLIVTFFADRFAIDPALLAQHGALDVSLVTDLPLFIDPFLLFHSKKPDYQKLHDGLIRYLVFLRDKANAGPVSEPLLRAWYCLLPRGEAELARVLTERQRGQRTWN
jgi:hypothetical protein